MTGERVEIRDLKKSFGGATVAQWVKNMTAGLFGAEAWV